MRWEGRRESGNVEDRRGSGGGGKLIGGGLGAAVIGLIIYFLGGDPSQVLNQGGNTANDVQTGQVEESRQEKRARQLVSVVLAETEDVWNKVLPEQAGVQYEEPKLDLFRGSYKGGCGQASAAMGPFYCPLDSKVYIDLSFYDELKNRFNAPGDFAMAYVVAHEVGHHVQHLLGMTEKVHSMQKRVSEAEANALSVRLELQADFYAGLWAHYAGQSDTLIEAGDIEAALNAANAIGDDKLQKESQGYVVPDAFTHGSSQQRMYWFKKGYETGDMKQGNTFSGDVALN